MTERLSPPAQVRERLEAARERGVPFDEAWRHVTVALNWASGGAERWAWLEVLGETEAEWRAAYEGQPSQALVLQSLGDLIA